MSYVLTWVSRYPMFWPEWAGILCSELSELVSFVLTWVSWYRWMSRCRWGWPCPPCPSLGYSSSGCFLAPSSCPCWSTQRYVHYISTYRDWSTRFIRSYLHNSDPPGLMTTTITNFRIQWKFGEAFWIMTHFLLEIKESGGFWFVKLYGWAASRDTVSLNF